MSARDLESRFLSTRNTYSLQSWIPDQAPSFRFASLDKALVRNDGGESGLVLHPAFVTIFKSSARSTFNIVANSGLPSALSAL